jgi:hypothetical protein
VQEARVHQALGTGASACPPRTHTGRLGRPLALSAPPHQPAQQTGNTARPWHAPLPGVGCHPPHPSDPPAMILEGAKSGGSAGRMDLCNAACHQRCCHPHATQVGNGTSPAAGAWVVAAAPASFRQGAANQVACPTPTHDAPPQQGLSSGQIMQLPQETAATVTHGPACRRLNSCTAYMPAAMHSTSCPTAYSRPVISS